MKFFLEKGIGLNNLFFLLLLFLSFNANATRFYVNVNATGTNSGLSWQNAFTDLQAALSNAIVGDEIWVASGVYKPTSTTDRTISFNLKNGVNIYGSFVGNESNISERDLSNLISTLSGDIGALGEGADNSYNILKANNINTDITLDGFRIISGKPLAGDEGGGIEVNSSSGKILLNNLTFFDNGGGAVYIVNSDVDILQSQFLFNVYDGGNGGAVYIFSNGGLSNVLIQDCIFNGNQARVSGAIEINAVGNITIDRCFIYNNTAEVQGGVMRANLSSASATNLILSNSLIVGNIVSNVLVSGSIINISGLSNSNTENFVMRNVTFAHNRITDNNSYAINLSFVNPSIYNSIIYGNTINSDDNSFIDSNASNPVIIENSLIENGFSGGVNILNEDPVFTNPNSLSNAPFDASTFDYTLQTTSNCINFGNNSLVDSNYNLDLNLFSRIFDGTVDLGAYEKQSNLGVNNVDLRELVVYYNKANNKISFSDFILSDKVSIYDITGRLVLTVTPENNQIDVKNLLLGLYIIKINTNLSKKILIY